MQHAIDGVGGAEAIALEEGVKVKGLVVPFVREIDGDVTGGAGDRVGTIDVHRLYPGGTSELP